MVLKIWQFWDSVDSDGKYKRVVCKYCNGHEQIKHAAKCKRHTLSCAKVPKVVKEMLTSGATKSSSSYVILANGELEEDNNETDTENTVAVQFITADADPQITDDTPPAKKINPTATVIVKKKDAPKVLSKGGRHRNSNILSASLCLIKELDAASLEVLDTAIHCRLEELDQN